MITDDIFTEQMVKTAKEMEAVTASELARYYRATMPKYESIDVSQLEGLNEAEQLNVIAKLTEDVKQQSKHVKLLNDVRDGKYRILFLALARHTERAREEIESIIGLGEVHNITEMLKNLSENNENNEEEDEDNE